MQQSEMTLFLAFNIPSQEEFYCQLKPVLHFCQMCSCVLFSLFGQTPQRYSVQGYICTDLACAVAALRQVFCLGTLMRLLVFLVSCFVCLTIVSATTYSNNCIDRCQRCFLLHHRAGPVFLSILFPNTEKLPSLGTSDLKFSVQCVLLPF